ncbi:MAG TPA: MBL fold metallo-hydrolase, partial [Anaerolineales bacterium]
MPAKLIKQEVGPWPMNTYVIIDPESDASAIVDPGAEADKILKSAKGTRVEKILITHGHFDHVDALAEIKAATGAPVYLHPAEADKFGLKYDLPLSHDQTVTLGNLRIRTIHTPGHTPGMICLDLGDGRIVVGDTIFVGGPGKTWSPEEFETTMRSMQEIVFQWPDETVFYPG